MWPPTSGCTVWVIIEYVGMILVSKLVNYHSNLSPPPFIFIKFISYLYVTWPVWRFTQQSLSHTHKYFSALSLFVSGFSSYHVHISCCVFVFSLSAFEETFFIFFYSPPQSFDFTSNEESFVLFFFKRNLSNESFFFLVFQTD